MAEYVVEFGKDGRPVEADGRLDAAAFHRNHEPIWAVLHNFLRSKSGDVLEAASGAGRALRADGRFFLYGPFKRDGKHTAVSNAVFDTSLREGNPAWGVRDIDDLGKLASSAGLALLETVEMPANNLILVFGRP